MGNEVQVGSVTVRFVYSEPAAPYSLLEWIAPAGAQAPPVHLHRRTAEGFYVLEGTFTFLVDSESIEVPNGSHVLVPPGQPHTFWNSGHERASCLIVISPPGFEAYFRALSDRLSPDPSEAEALAVRRELSARFDIEVVGPAPT